MSWSPSVMPWSRLNASIRSSLAGCMSATVLARMMLREMAKDAPPISPPSGRARALARYFLDCSRVTLAPLALAGASKETAVDFADMVRTRNQRQTTAIYPVLETI